MRQGGKRQGGGRRGLEAQVPKINKAFLNLRLDPTPGPNTFQ